MKRLLPSLVVVLLIACSGPTTTQQPSVTPSQCKYPRPDLPDPKCTPGIINQSVRQDNIHETICVSGYTASIRPDTSVTNRIKVERLIAYGQPTESIRNYELDHLIPLELGGHPTDVRNLWPELGYHEKDLVENKLHGLVCSGQMTLAEAQSIMATDWTKGK